jgi:hypothetical protein
MKLPLDVQFYSNYLTLTTLTTLIIYGLIIKIIRPSSIAVHLAPALEKEELASLVTALKGKLNDPDRNSGIRNACSLIVYMLINFDNDFTVEINTASVNTYEALLCQAVSEWVKEIKFALNQPEVVSNNLPSVPGFAP